MERVHGFCGRKIFPEESGDNLLIEASSCLHSCTGFGRGFSPPARARPRGWEGFLSGVMRKALFSSFCGLPCRIFFVRSCLFIICRNSARPLLFEQSLFPLCSWRLDGRMSAVRGASRIYFVMVTCLFSTAVLCWWVELFTATFRRVQRFYATCEVLRVQPNLAMLGQVYIAGEVVPVHHQ